MKTELEIKEAIIRQQEYVDNVTTGIANALQAKNPDLEEISEYLQDLIVANRIKSVLEWCLQ